MSSNQECFDWKENGSCKYGENCRFLHGSESTLGSRRKQEQLCFTFRDKGECEYGDNCRFSHDLNAAATTTTAPKGRRPRGDGNNAAAASSAPVESKGDAPARKPRRRNRAAKDRSAEPSDAPAKPERKERIPAPKDVEGGRLECLHWKKSRECPYGEDCRYVHDGEPTRGSRRKQELVCYTFRETGECKFGSDCRYSHDPTATKESLETSKPAKQAAPAAAPARKPCRDFAAGNCAYGDKCRFSHEVKGDQL